MPNSSRAEVSLQVARLEKRVRDLEAENEMLRRLLSRHGYPDNTDTRRQQAAAI